MTVSIRQLAVSGGTAALLLGGAAALTMAAPSPASATTQTAAVNAVTAPVNLPDGRTLRITGMGGYGHRATEAHVAAVAAYKTDTNSTTTGQTPATGGAGTILQNPYNTPSTQTGYNQQITTQSASGGVIGVGVVAILALSIIVFFKVKHGHIKPADAVLVALLGIALSGTIVGSMGSSLTNSIVGSLSSALGGLS